VFLAGVGFSLACLTPDGEVAYMGRGANNIYHMASAIAAFSHAARRVRSIDPASSARLGRAAHLVFEYLGRARRPDGMLPVAVNDRIDLRMAWNHCHTPYDALSSYFLARAAADRVELDNREREGQVPAEVVGRFERPGDGRFTFVTRPGYYATHFAGAERSYWWSAPNHFTGAPGLAMLGISGRGALLPILDGTMTEHPCQGGDPCGPARVALSSGPPAALIVEREVRRTYVFLDDAILITTRGRGGDWALRVPTREDGEWRSDVEWHGNLPSVVATDGKAGFTWSLLAHGGEIERDEHAERLSNPRGYALLRRVGRVRRPDVEHVRVEVLVPFDGTPRAFDGKVALQGGTVEIVMPWGTLAESPSGLSAR
jgi:hypothetical protein